MSDILLNMMDNPTLNVREFATTDIPVWTDYWCKASDEFLLGMGVDLNKKPHKTELVAMMEGQLQLELDARKSYALIWEVDGRPVGHCNVGDIEFGVKANMHLHLWENALRRRGWGTILVRRSLPYFFNRLKLKVLYCEPYALNPAPNRVIPELGFTFVKRYTTIPGPLCFEQEVNQYSMTRTQFEKQFSREMRRTTSTDPHFIELVNLLDAELEIIDGDEHEFYHQFNGIEALNHVVVMYVDGFPAGCGAMKSIGESTMEIKRMYTRPEYRGTGIGLGVLSELESWARAMQMKRCILETGKRQEDALGLYTKNLYSRISNYGPYVGIDNSVCFEKVL
jgi:RimJ/RimL family protein N-acetyltransferase